METSSSRGATTDAPDPTWTPLVRRLSDEFGPTVSPEEIDEYVATMALNYADARIKTYVPVLLERQVRERLRERVAAAATSP